MTAVLLLAVETKLTRAHNKETLIENKRQTIIVEQREDYGP